MKRAAFFAGSGALAFLVSLSGAASAQDAVAVITELNFKRGENQLRVTSSAAAAKPTVLPSLYAGADSDEPASHLFRANFTARSA